MIDTLIQGKLHGQPQERTGKSGKPFAVAKLTAADGDGESLFVNVIAFDTDACRALLALGTGDAVAVAGPVTPKAWTDKHREPRIALDVVAHQVLTTYHVTRKRKAMQPEQESTRARDEAWQAAAPERHSSPF